MQKPSRLSVNCVYIINLDIERGSTMLHYAQQETTFCGDKPHPSNDLHNLIGAMIHSRNFLKKLTQRNASYCLSCNKVCSVFLKSGPVLVEQ